MSRRSRDTPIQESRQEALRQPIFSSHTAGHRNPKREPTAFAVQGSYAAMFAGEFAAGIRQGGGRYAVTHRAKITTQKIIQSSENLMNWLHDRFLRNVIFTIMG
jgi:hypothetical protein